MPSTPCCTVKPPNRLPSSPAATMGMVTEPAVVQKSCNAEGCHYELYIPPALAYFVGHFPELALLPGVTQLKWAVEFARADLGRPASTTIERLKFMRPIVPGQRVTLVLKVLGPHKTEFAYRDANHLCSQGVLCHE